MAFQFLCPQGHLLMGEDWQMGQQCQCPMCGMAFIIPVPPGHQPHVPEPSPAAVYEDFTAAPESSGYGFDAVADYAAAHAPATEIEPEHHEAPTAAAGEFLGEPDAVRIVHIPCPNGHELETPFDMMGQDVLCPFCGEQFQLNYSDSVEHKKERQLERERRELVVGQKWLNIAIVIAFVVVGGLIALIAATRG